VRQAFGKDFLSGSAARWRISAKTSRARDLSVGSQRQAEIGRIVYSLFDFTPDESFWKPRSKDSIESQELSRPEHGDVASRAQLGVGGDEGQRAVETVRDEHPVEGIAVVPI
jgi:hypothetical protein